MLKFSPQKHKEEVERLGELVQKLDSSISSDIKHFTQSYALVRLYVLLETYLIALADEWLKFLSETSKKFSDLPESLRDYAVKAIANTLSQSDKYLSQRNLIRKEAAEWASLGLAKDESFWIPKILKHRTEGNFRSDVIDSFFSKLGTKKTCISHISTDPAIKDFIEESGLNRTCKNYIDELVQRRNEAAHSLPDELLSVADISNMIRLVGFIFDSLHHWGKLEWLSLAKERNQVEQLGLVSEHFKKSQAYILKLEKGQISIGQELIASFDNRVVSIRLNSLQIDDESVEKVGPEESTIQVGFQIKPPHEIKKGAMLFRYTS